MSVLTGNRPSKRTPSEVGERPSLKPRWWKRPLIWSVGLPVLLLVVLGGLVAWGRSQPRPEGYAVVAQSAPTAEALTLVDPDEIRQFTLDASSRESFVQFDFVTGAVVEAELQSDGWDVAFERTKVLTNSGETNPDGPGGAFDLGEVDLADASVPDRVAWVADTMAGDDDDELFNEAAGRWYTYSLIRHVVGVKPNTYLFRTGEDVDAMVQFDSYYCEDEEPACVTFSYRLVPAIDER